MKSQLVRQVIVLLIAMGCTALAATKHRTTTPPAETQPSLLTLPPFPATDDPLLAEVIRGRKFSEYATVLRTRIAAALNAAPQPDTLLQNPALARDLLRLKFIDFARPTELDAATKLPKRSEFLAWVLNHQELMREVAATEPSSHGEPEHKHKGKHKNKSATKDDSLGDEEEGYFDFRTVPHGFVELWHRIWLTQSTADRETYRRFAAGVALGHAQPVADKEHHTIDPLKRYAWYVQKDQEGKLISYFTHATVNECRMISRVTQSEEQMDWIMATIHKEKQKQAKIADVCRRVKYTKFNPDNGASVQNGAAFYEGRPKTFQTVVEMGGVCGAISNFGADVAKVFGVPAMPVGQPGHCAFVIKVNGHDWGRKYSLHGWEETKSAKRIEPWDNNGSYIPLYEQLMRNPQAVTCCELLLLAGECTDKPAVRKTCFVAAVEVAPLQYGAWQKLFALKTADLGALKTRASEALKSFPWPKEKLLTGKFPPLPEKKSGTTPLIPPPDDDDTKPQSAATEK